MHPQQQFSMTRSSMDRLVHLLGVEKIHSHEAPVRGSGPDNLALIALGNDRGWTYSTVSNVEREDSTGQVQIVSYGKRSFPVATRTSILTMEEPINNAIAMHHPKLPSA